MRELHSGTLDMIECHHGVPLDTECPKCQAMSPLEKAIRESVDLQERRCPVAPSLPLVERLWRIKQDSEGWLYEHPTKILKEAADRIAELEYRHENQKDNIAAYQREQVKLMARIAELEKMTETQMDVGADYVERIAELEKTNKNNSEEIDMLRSQLHEEIELHDKPEIEVRAHFAARIAELEGALEKIAKGFGASRPGAYRDFARAALRSDEK
jgi:predicted RNase H-like nuclease (RuvC/YqgF family)